MLIPKHVNGPAYHDYLDIKNRTFRLTKKHAYLYYALKFSAMKQHFVDTNEESIFEFVKHFYPECMYDVDRVSVNYPDIFGNMQTSKGMILTLTIFDQHNNLTKTVKVPENSWVIIEVDSKDVPEIKVMNEYDMLNEYDIVDQTNDTDPEPAKVRSVVKIGSPTESMQNGTVHLTFEVPNEYKVGETEVQSYDVDIESNNIVQTKTKQFEEPEEKPKVRKVFMITVPEVVIKNLKHNDSHELKLPMDLIPMRIRNRINKYDKLIIGSETSTDSIQKIITDVTVKNDGYVYIYFGEENND